MGKSVSAYDHSQGGVWLVIRVNDVDINHGVSSAVVILIKLSTVDCDLPGL